MWSLMPKNTPSKQRQHPRLRRLCEVVWKDCKSQRIREFPVSPSKVRGYIHKISLTQLPRHELTKGNNRHAKVDSGKNKRPQPYTNTNTQLRNTKVDKKKILCPLKENISWLSNTKWSALKTYIQVILYILNLLYLRIYRYICVTIFN